MILFYILFFMSYKKSILTTWLQLYCWKEPLLFRINYLGSPRYTAGSPFIFLKTWVLMLAWSKAI
jgi:hypothetical protein